MADMEKYLAQWPQGVIRSVAELKVSGVTKSEIHRAVKKSILKSVGYGGYARAIDSVSWQHGLCALQCSPDGSTPSYFLGGAAALAFNCGDCSGAPRIPHVYFHVFEERPFPTWFKDLADRSAQLAGTSAEFYFYNTHLPLNIPDSFRNFNTLEGLTYQISSPERALLEFPLTQKDLPEIQKLLLCMPPFKEEVMTLLLRRAFPGPVRLQLLRLLGERMKNNGRGELLAIVKKFVPGETPWRAWFPLTPADEQLEGVIK